MGGCSRSPDTPSQQASQYDASLPKIDTMRTLPDINEIGFEWTPIHDDRVEGYYIYRVEGGNSKRIATIKDKYVSHYVDTKLKPETTYNYRMSTYSSSKKESEPSSMVSVTTTGTIESVPFLKAITGLPSRIKLVWRPHPMDRVESYIIERSELKSNEWKEIARIEGRLNAEYIDKDLKDNHFYRYRVKVKTYDGIISKPSDVVEATTKPLPKSVIGVGASTDLPKKIILKWEPVIQEDLSFYKIYRSSNSMMFYSYYGKTTATEFEDLINENGTNYYYKVVAVDVDGLESPEPKNAVMGTTLAALAAPKVSSIKQEGHSIALSWVGDEHAVKYNLTREFEEAGSTKKQNFTGIFEPHYYDTDTMPGVTYTYKITAIDKYGIASENSDAITITIPQN
mgnify:CR=1 FL=1